MAKKEEFVNENGFVNKQVCRSDFPPNFVFGFATSSYQIQETCFASFGDRVKHWISINEPLQTAINGYDIGIFAPGRCENSLIEPYLAAHYQILAHAAAVSVYPSKYQEKQRGQAGMVVDCECAEAYSDKIADKSAAARCLDFQLGWFLDPLCFANYSKLCVNGWEINFRHSWRRIRSCLHLDFIGLNPCKSRLISHVTESSEGGHCYRSQAMERIVEWEGGELIGEKAATEWLYAVPWGIRKTELHGSEVQTPDIRH